MVPVHLMVAANAAKTVARQFRDAGAVEPGRAIAWTPGDKTQEGQFRRLVGSGALVEMRPGTWYLNEEKLAASGAARGVTVAVLLGLVAVGAGLALVLG